jgi:hypothetical protein
MPLVECYVVLIFLLIYIKISLRSLAPLTSMCNIFHGSIHNTKNILWLAPTCNLVRENSKKKKNYDISWNSRMNHKKFSNSRNSHHVITFTPLSLIRLTWQVDSCLLNRLFTTPSHLNYPPGLLIIRFKFDTAKALKDDIMS